jgi:predicted porin
MKKNIIALAIASAIAAPVAFADAPTVYGQANVAIEQMDVDSAGGTVATDQADTAASGTQVNDRASRLGVKGSEDLGNGLKAIYKMEFAVNITDSSQINSRNQYVGLAGGFGTILMGRHDTPTKMIQGKDLFNDSFLADNRRMAGGLGGFGRGMENRVSEVVAYVSPSFAGVKLIAALVPQEGESDLNAADQDESTLTDMYSVALAYGSKKSGLYLAAGMDSATEQTTGIKSGEAQQYRLVAQYATGGLMANAMYQDFSGDALEDTTKGGTNIQANLGYTMGKFTPKLKVSMVDIDKGATTDYDTTGDDVLDTTRGTDEDSMNYAVGLDYALGKKTTAYVEYAMIENSKGVKDADTNAMSVGLLHKF